jgi:hypothetical protein
MTTSLDQALIKMLTAMLIVTLTAVSIQPLVTSTLRAVRSSMAL